MSIKHDLILNLRGVFDSWEQLLSSKSAAEITAKASPGDWSICDVIVHLAAWQKVSSARLEAALLEAEPAFPAWLAGADPFYADQHTREFNARINALYRDQD